MEMGKWKCDDVYLPKQVPLERWAHKNGQDTTEKVLLAEKTALHAGQAHSMVISDRGEMWTCGVADDFRLGGGENNGDQARLQQVLPFVRERIATAAAGFIHSFALTPDGRLYVWGGVTNGRGGLGRERVAKLPTQVAIDYEALF